MRRDQPGLLSIPPEIRLHIYSFLLDDGGDRWLAVRNKPAPPGDGVQRAPGGPGADVHRREHEPATSGRRSTTTYNVMEQTSMFHRRCYETTYALAGGRAELHTAILGVCRRTYAEAADVLYGRHGFDFGPHIEAVVPFLADRTAHTRRLVRSVSVYKRGPMPLLGSTSDRYEWSYMCRHLATRGAVSRLRIVVECGRPAQPWEGVQDLSESDVRLLSLIGHECLEWVRDLAKVKSLEDLDVIPDVKYLPEPKSPSMVLYAALSASVDKGLAGFLRSEMLVPK